MKSAGAGSASTISTGAGSARATHYLAEAMRRLHEEIRRGARFQITDVPVREGDRVRIETSEIHDALILED